MLTLNDIKIGMKIEKIFETQNRYYLVNDFDSTTLYCDIYNENGIIEYLNEKYPINCLSKNMYEISYFPWETSQPKVPERHNCICEYYSVLRNGCKCGGK